MSLRAPLSRDSSRFKHVLSVGTNPVIHYTVTSDDLRKNPIQLLETIERRNNKKKITKLRLHYPFEEWMLLFDFFDAYETNIELSFVIPQVYYKSMENFDDDVYRKNSGGVGSQIWNFVTWDYTFRRSRL